MSIAPDPGGLLFLAGFVPAGLNCLLAVFDPAGLNCLFCCICSGRFELSFWLDCIACSMPLERRFRLSALGVDDTVRHKSCSIQRSEVIPDTLFLMDKGHRG